MDNPYFGYIIGTIQGTPSSYTRSFVSQFPTFVEWAQNRLVKHWGQDACWMILAVTSVLYFADEEKTDLIEACWLVDKTELSPDEVQRILKEGVEV